ncbi:MAG: hypothetical protein QM817_41705 [Archangium sp.]
MISFDEVVALIRPRGRSLIAIDGLPCAGKSTLSEKIFAELGIDSVSIDDFLIPFGAWPDDIAPAFPFPYFRNDEFERVVRGLSRGENVSYVPYDWALGRTSDQLRHLEGSKSWVVEGCSVLAEHLSEAFDVRLFVKSDAGSLMAARTRRDGEVDVAKWRDLYLPSVERYLATRPEERAQHLVAGRMSPVET